MKKPPKVSVVIPLYIKTPYFYESVGRCLELDYPDFEILVGVDGKTKVELKDRRVRILRTGEKRTGPAEKRDICLRHAKGKYIAFLDDDSYPETDWLTKSIEILERKKVTAVCGPGLTPPLDSFSQKITGAILSSKFGSGPYFYRFAKDSSRFVDDYPAYNMMVVRETLIKVGGWGTKFYGGEDTALCLKLINAGEKIFYHPDIVVYHHRRSFPVDYARQVGNVGKHRGYFVKKYPETSLRFSYFAPAIFAIGFPAMLIISAFSPYVFYFSIASLVLFWLAVMIESSRKTSFIINLVLPLAIIVNYLSYGYNFLDGLLFTKNLDN